MIRSRIGAVGIGAGGSATTYQFDATGLSNDPRLAPYLQNLTPAQLQTALDDRDPSQDLADLLQQEQTGTGAGWLPCGSAGSSDPNCTGAGAAGFSLSDVPMAAWVAGGALLALLLIPRR